MHTIAEIDAMDAGAFQAVLGSVVEHSPWVAGEAWRRRPFGSPAALRLAFEAVLRLAPPDRQLALLNAHPELGDRQLTDASAREQAQARLDRLPAADLALLRQLNAAYRERFGFPFISCVREHSVASLLAWAQARLERDRDAEAETALTEVGKIVALRLRERVA